jgi:16S rRNA (uracil1498-N3)-methyltransferase
VNDIKIDPGRPEIHVRLHRLHTEARLDPGEEIKLEKSQAHYLGRVLRALPGQAVVLFNGDGHDYAGEITVLSKQGVTVAVTSRLPATREPALEITVVQAISRGERMDQTLQKCTELGAARFQPLFSERVEVRLKPDRLGKRLEHWRAVVISACEQSGRAVVPEVLGPLDIDDWLDRNRGGTRIVLDPAAHQSLTALEIGNPLELVLGPEGGFSDAERALLRSHGVAPAALGPRLLRTETAGPAALAVVQSMAGDFSQAGPSGLDG